MRRSPATGSAERSVLIVDDNPQKTLALQSVVEELNLSAVVVGSAEAALRELLRQNFALALLDVHMPRIDGFELAGLIRSRPADQDLPIVFMSAIKHTDERLEKAYALGAIDFIVLPARRPIIKAKLAAILGLRKSAAPLPSGPAGGNPPAGAPDRVRLLLDAADDVAIFFLEPTGTIAEWSHGAELCTGWPANEIIGRPFSVLFAPGDVADRFSRCCICIRISSRPRSTFRLRSARAVRRKSPRKKERPRQNGSAGFKRCAAMRWRHCETVRNVASNHRANLNSGNQGGPQLRRATSRGPHLRRRDRKQVALRSDLRTV